MPSVHDTLLEAPIVRQNPLTVEFLKTTWVGLHGYMPKMGEGGKLVMDGSITAALMWRMESFRNVALPNYTDNQEFVNLVQLAQSNLQSMRRGNPKIQAIHNHILNNWG